MDGPALFVLYVVTKLAAYASWCFLGLSLFAPERLPRIPQAITFGAGRFLLGVVVGGFIFLAALSMNNAVRNAWLTYAAIYVPVRVAEWSLWYVLLRRRSGGVRAVAWILGGVLVSCLADVPIGLAEGGVVPVGRPFCALPARPPRLG